MAQTVNTNLGSSILKFIFTDDDGDVVASFRLNPADVRLAGRVREAAEFFAQAAKEAPAEATAEDILRYNDAVEEKLRGESPETGVMQDMSNLSDQDYYASCYPHLV